MRLHMCVYLLMLMLFPMRCPSCLLVICLPECDRVEKQSVITLSVTILAQVEFDSAIPPT